MGKTVEIHFSKSQRSKIRPMFKDMKRNDRSLDGSKYHESPNGAFITTDKSNLDKLKKAFDSKGVSYNIMGEGIGDSVKGAYYGAKSKYHGAQAKRQDKKYKKNKSGMYKSTSDSGDVSSKMKKKSRAADSAAKSRSKHTAEKMKADRKRAALKKESEIQLSEKAKSEIQQQAAGAALAAKRGEIPVSDLQGASKRMHDDMTEKELEDFAGTKHDTVPEKVSENTIIEEAIDPGIISTVIKLIGYGFLPTMGALMVYLYMVMLGLDKDLPRVAKQWIQKVKDERTASKTDIEKFEKELKNRIKDLPKGKKAHAMYLFNKKGDASFATDKQAVGRAIRWVKDYLKKNDIEMNESDTNNLAERWMINEVDSEAATELEMYITNDGQIYRSRIQPIIKNLAKKKSKGQYDPKKAVKAWMYAVEDGAKKYAKEFDSANNWHKIFDKKTREAVAKELSSFYEEEIDELVVVSEGNSIVMKGFEMRGKLLEEANRMRRAIGLEPLTEADEYDKFFKQSADKFGIDPDAVDELPDEKKKEFFDYIDSNWNSDSEFGDDGEVEEEGCDYKKK